MKRTFLQLGGLAVVLILGTFVGVATAQDGEEASGDAWKKQVEARIAATDFFGDLPMGWKAKKNDNMDKMVLSSPSGYGVGVGDYSVWGPGRARYEVYIDYDIEAEDGPPLDEAQVLLTYGPADVEEGGFYAVIDSRAPGQNRGPDPEEARAGRLATQYKQALTDVPAGRDVGGVAREAMSNAALLNEHTMHLDWSQISLRSKKLEFVHYFTGNQGVSVEVTAGREDNPKLRSAAIESLAQHVEEKLQRIAQGQNAANVSSAYWQSFFAGIAGLFGMSLFAASSGAFATASGGMSAAAGTAGGADATTAGTASPPSPANLAAREQALKWLEQVDAELGPLGAGVAGGYGFLGIDSAIGGQEQLIQSAENALRSLEEELKAFDAKTEQLEQKLHEAKTQEYPCSEEAREILEEIGNYERFLENADEVLADFDRRIEEWRDKLADARRDGADEDTIRYYEDRLKTLQEEKTEFQHKVDVVRARVAWEEKRDDDIAAAEAGLEQHLAGRGKLEERRIELERKIEDANDTIRDLNRKLEGEKGMDTDWWQDTTGEYAEARKRLEDFLENASPDDPGYQAELKRLQDEVARAANQVKQAQAYGTGNVSGPDIPFGGDVNPPEEEIVEFEPEQDFYRDMLKGDLQGYKQEREYLLKEIEYYKQFDPDTHKRLLNELGKVDRNIRRVEAEFRAEYGHVPDVEVTESIGPQATDPELVEMSNDIADMKQAHALMKQYEDKLAKISDPDLRWKYYQLIDKARNEDGSIDMDKFNEIRAHLRNDFARQGAVDTFHAYSGQEAFMDTTTEFADILTRETPGVNVIRNAIELGTGKNLYTGQDVSASESILGIGMGMLPMAGKSARFASCMQNMPGAEKAFNALTGAMKYHGRYDLADAAYKFASGDMTTGDFVKKVSTAGYGHYADELPGGVGAVADEAASHLPDGTPIRPDDVDIGKPPDLDDNGKIMHQEWQAGEVKARKVIDDFKDARAQKDAAAAQLRNAKQKFGVDSDEYRSAKSAETAATKNLIDKTAEVNQNYQAKLHFKSAGDIDPTGAEFDKTLRDEVYSRVDAKFEQEMADRGYSPQEIQEFRNKSSAGSASMDRDLGFKEPSPLDPKYPLGKDDPQFQKDTFKWRQGVTKNGKRVPIHEANEDAQHAYNMAYLDVTGRDAEKAFQEFTSSQHSEAYSDPNVLINDPAKTPFSSKHIEQTGDVSRYKHGNNMKMADEGIITNGEAMMESVRGMQKDIKSKLLPLMATHGAQLPPNMTKVVKIFQQVSDHPDLSPAHLQGWLQRETGLSLDQAVNQMSDLFEATSKLGPTLK